ncbi:MAG: T9SS type A sorting domain-containing protein [Crocinitomicaceae bacterium]|nr:T9SS type A sorting domain-containing protein [Crocinitomicaceae bacterium]
MKNIYTLTIAVCSTICVCSTASAQELNVISGGGNYAESANHSVSWTVGESVIVTATSSSNQITQGFHQPNLAVVSVEEYSDLDISVYPNPARNQFNVEASENTKLTIYDAQGKLVQVMDIFSSQKTVDVSDLSRGTYTLVFEANGAIAKRMKIIIL